MVVGTVTEPKPHCPSCGAAMRLIPKGRGKTTRDFWGCPFYPECKGTREVDPETGLPEGDEGPRRSARAEFDEASCDEDPFDDEFDEDDDGELLPW